jgi:GMP synthase (glutamine-hydrolysing)
MPTATILCHIAFEDLGSLAPLLVEMGYDVSYRNIGDADFLDFDPAVPNLLVVLGGPVGVYEETFYPFLGIEKKRIASRLSQGLPTLGICLGAQLIAAALGSRVFPSKTKEIGFSQLSLSEYGMQGPLRYLDGVQVLHWHSDTYDLPPGANHLAATDAVGQQAFAIGSQVLGLQFHAEVNPQAGFERWLVGHASELAAAKVDIPALRGDAQTYGEQVVQASGRMFREWLIGLPRR